MAAAAASVAALVLTVRDAVPELQLSFEDQILTHVGRDAFKSVSVSLASEQGQVQQRSLPLMISFFGGDPCDLEYCAHSKSMQLECEPGANRMSSPGASGQLAYRRPCATRQSDILKPANIVHLRLDTAEHVNLNAFT